MARRRRDEDDESDDDEETKRLCVALAAALPLVVGSQTNYSVVGKQPNAIRDRTAVMQKINDLRRRNRFKRMYRLTEEDFDHVVALITPVLQKRVISTSIPIEIKLAAALRMLAGGSYLDICFGYDLDEHSVHGQIAEVCMGSHRRRHRPVAQQHYLPHRPRRTGGP